MSFHDPDSMTYVPLACQENTDLSHHHHSPLRFVVLSDTHNTHNDFEDLPEGDILLHTGDFTKWGLINELSDFKSYLHRQSNNFKHIVLIPGNHEFFPDMVNSYFYSWIHGLDNTKVHYLLDSVITIEGVTIYGSRFKPHSHFNWLYPTGRDCDAKTSFDDVPMDIPIDIVLTHQPPKLSSLDRQFFRRGNQELTKIIMKKDPAVHIFGHNHESFGYRYARDDPSNELSHLKTTFISAPSIHGYHGEKRRKPIVFDFVPRPTQ